MKTVLVQSNYWHNPGIKITLQHDEIAPEGAIHVEADFEDVVKALLNEMDHPIKIWTRQRLESAIRKALETTLEKVKESTIKVM